MSDVNVSVSTTPIEIAFSATQVDISVASAGVQGLQGVAGVAGTGSSTSTAGITGISVSGGAGFTGNFNILAGSNITLSQAGNSLTIIAASTSADVSGLISTGNADLRYLYSGSSGAFYVSSNPNQFIKSGDVDLKLNGLISTGSADNRYLLTGVSGEFLKSSNLNGLINTGDARTIVTNYSGNSQFFRTLIPTGIDSYFISYPINFLSIPFVVATVELTGDILYSLNIRNRTVSGYSGMFSDTIQEISGVYVNSWCSINV